MPRDPINSNMSHILSEGCRLTVNPSSSKFCYWHHIFIVYGRIIYSCYISSRQEHVSRL